MSMTLTLAPARRRRVVGLSRGPQGADGVSTLAREAYLDMLAAQWEDDPDDPTMPVHEFDRRAPTGQAYKAIYGYDAAERTERSACGAECYTYCIPADALDDTNEDGVADIESVTLRIAGDRYLDRGVCVYCELSDSPEPSPVAVAIASGAGAAYLATQSQLDDDGNPLPPNRRTGAEADVVVGVGGAACAYLHVHLFLADYHGSRGAWIEGGAMFAAANADVVFSRDVETTDDSGELGACAMDVGRVTLDPTGTVTAAYAVQHLPRASIWSNYSITLADAVLAKLSATFAVRVRDMLALIYSSPGLWTSTETGKLAASTTVGYANAGMLRLYSSSVSLCALCVHGLTGGRTFRGMRFANALPASMPYRLLVYGISGDISIADSSSGSSLRFSTPLAHWADVLSRSFRSGGARQLRVTSDATLAGGSMATATAGKTESVGVVPLAAMDVTDAVQRVAFDEPFKTDEIASVVIALIPNGAPNGSTATPVEYAATATRSIVVTIPVAATRQPLVENETVSGTISFRAENTIKDDVQRCYNVQAYISTFGEYAWTQQTANAMAESYDKPANVILSGIDISFTRGGKTYSYNTGSGDDLPSLTIQGRFHLYSRPDNLAWGPMKFRYAVTSSAKISFVAHAPDGSTLPVEATLDGDNTFYLRTDGGADDLRGEEDVTFDASWGYFSPKDWLTQTGSVTGRATNIDTTSRTASTLFASVRATLVGGVYSFASASNEIVSASVTQSGVVTFSRNGVSYTAQYSVSGTRAIGVGGKTTGTRTVYGNDTSETATCYGDVAAISQRMLFAGSDGSTLYADVSLPSAMIRGNVPFQARSAWLGSSQGIGTVYDDGHAVSGKPESYTLGLHGTATVSEAYAEATVDPGLVTLYE